MPITFNIAENTFKSNELWQANLNQQQGNLNTQHRFHEITQHIGNTLFH